MSLEQTIKDTLLSESADLDLRLQQLVRAGLMPANTIPLLRKGIAKVQGGYPLVGAERDVMANFLNSMMFIVLGDDTIFNKARTGAKHYATEEIDKDLEDELKKTRQTKKSVEDAKEKYGIKEGENKEMKDKDPCWKGYEMVGMKKKGGRQVPNCVPANEEVEAIDELSRATVGRYSLKAKSIADNEGGKDRSKGRELAGRKRWGGTMSGVPKARVMAKESRRNEALADIASVTQMNESYRSTFNAALTQYGIKSPSELDEEQRKQFFNFVDQEYKKGDN